MARKYIKICVLSILIICMAGCGVSQFDDDYRDFKDIYLRVTDMLDLKEPFSSIDNLNDKGILEEIEVMKDIVSRMNEEASTKNG